MHNEKKTVLRKDVVLSKKQKSALKTLKRPQEDLDV